MNHFLRLAAMILIALSTAIATAAPITRTERVVKEFPIDATGSFWLDNPIGNIEVVGTDGGPLSVLALKVVTGADEAAVRDGMEQTQLTIGGNTPQVRSIRTVLPPRRTQRWSSNVSYVVRLPRTVHVKILSSLSERIRVVNVAASVSVKNSNGMIVLENVGGGAIVSSVNGNIQYTPSGRVSGNVQLETVNGTIEVRVPPASRFEWVAESIRGAFHTNLPVRGRFSGNIYRTTLNGGGGPVLRTGTIMGNIYVIRQGSTVQQATMIRQPAEVVKDPGPGGPNTGRVPLGPGASQNEIQMPFIDGDGILATKLGNISVGQINGKARVETGAGQVQLGVVHGECQVISGGGPLELTDIMGFLFGRTAAGDITVRNAREGAELFTDGGVIRLQYSGGPTNLHSGGGDIVLGQANGPVNADTSSGDIAVTINPHAKSERVTVKTAKGNVILHLPLKFAADVDATIVTAHPDKNSIRSDFPGLSLLRREQIGSGKTLIRMTGRINGGGERIEIFAEDGNIQILSRKNATDLKPR